MKASNIFFGIMVPVFVLFAFFQLNDPDPEVWVPIYLIPAVLSGFAAAGRFPMIPIVAVGLLCLAGSLYFFPSEVGEWVAQEWEQKDLTMKTPDMEQARESFGLLIIAIVMGIAALVGWRKKRKAKKRYGSKYNL